MRLIDADDLSNFLTALEDAGAEHISFDDMKKFLREWSTIDAEPVRNGK